MPKCARNFTVLTYTCHSSITASGQFHCAYHGCTSQTTEAFHVLLEQNDMQIATGRIGKKFSSFRFSYLPLLWLNANGKPDDGALLFLANSVMGTVTTRTFTMFTANSPTLKRVVESDHRSARKLYPPRVKQFTAVKRLNT